MVQLFVQRGVSVDAVDGYGMKAVDHAVLEGWPKTVELIGGSSSGGGGRGCSGLAELRQYTVLFRWQILVRKEVVLARFL